jgi:valyl-tRNA synthetase
MGSSCDWSREKFTMNESLNRCVNEVFVKMHRDGLIYKGNRIVNWCPQCQSTLSDDEVVYKEQQETFFTIRYGPLLIGTVRPETKFGDTAIAVHPDDDRYKQYIGKEIEIETAIGLARIKVIADRAVDPQFSTGVIKVTPAHDFVDFDLAQRHGLEVVQVIDEQGRMMEKAGLFKGMTTAECRSATVAMMKRKGILEKEEPYTHNLSVCYRCQHTVEPLPKLQWFVDVNKKAVRWKKSFGFIPKQWSLKEVMQDVVNSGDITIIPDRFEKTYFHWIDNLRDWCISRQIWWGHRIPVWYKGDEVFCGVTPPEGPTPKIIFARHGQSTGNRDHLAQGQDDQLTEKGIEHAQNLKEALKHRSITRIISSRSVRAYDTAQAVAKHFGLKVEIWDEINGYDFGDIAGTPEVEGKMNIERALEAKQGESLEEYFVRSKKACDKIAALESDGDILIISHRTNLSAIDVIRAGGSVDDILGARRKNEDADYGLWGEISQSRSDEDGWEQDPDTLDTWFSSALWTWSTLIDPNLTDNYSLSLADLLKQSPDFQKFHPTQVMETGYDILFFWVARMILMTTYATGQIPFETVYLHGLIRTRDGEKMSKSKPETMIDPLDIIPKYGADALRLSMIVGQSPGNDSKLFEEKIAGYRNFVNKLWNASRFVLMQCQEAGVDVHATGLDREALSLADRAVLSELQSLIEDTSEGLEHYRLSEVGERLYSFTWDFFCDWYLELSKGSFNAPVALHVLRTLLHLLHPYCPFVTEELWDAIKPADSDMLMKQGWPTVIKELQDDEATEQLQIIVEVISAIRQLRSEYTIESSKKIAVVLVGALRHGSGQASHAVPLLKEQESHIRRLARVESLTVQGEKFEGENAASAFTKHVEVHIPLEGVIDVAKEKERLTKEKDQLSRFLKGVQGKLQNKAFVKNAPEEVISKEEQKAEDAKGKLKKVEEKLARLR